MWLLWVKDEWKHKWMHFNQSHKSFHKHASIIQRDSSHVWLVGSYYDQLSLHMLRPSNIFRDYCTVFYLDSKNNISVQFTLNGAYILTWSCTWLFCVICIQSFTFLFNLYQLYCCHVLSYEWPVSYSSIVLHCSFAYNTCFFRVQNFI